MKSGCELMFVDDFENRDSDAIYNENNPEKHRIW